MYVVATHIPVYVSHDATFVDQSWNHDLMLMRQWLAGPGGRMAILAPSISLSKSEPELDVPPLVRIGNDDEIRVRPSFDARCSAKKFWLQSRKTWLRDLGSLLDEASIMHCSVSDVFRPMWYLALNAAADRRIPTVMVGPDCDPHLILPDSIKGRVAKILVDAMIARGARRADLVLFKKGSVIGRYGRVSINAKEFCHSVHSRDDVISEVEIEQRLLALSGGRVLRAVYAGRFVARKGLRDAILAIAAANGLVEFHLYGTGPQETELRHLVRELGIEHLVHFHGWIDRNDAIVDKLARNDILLFMPTEEDTPRMFYDALAAGLPVVGTRIPFLSHHVRDDRCGELVDIGDSAAAGKILTRLANSPAEIEILTLNAVRAGNSHAVERWYMRRSEWTSEIARNARE